MQMQKNVFDYYVNLYIRKKFMISKEKKIFVLGFNKTGTSSTTFLLKTNNLPITQKGGWNKECPHRNVHDCQTCSECSKPKILKILKRYCGVADTTFDVPFFRQRFPKASFLLNVRPLRSWLKSRYKHALYAMTQIKSEVKYYWPPSNEKTKAWISQRQKMHRTVIDEFSKTPKQLFIYNIEKKGWQTALLNFLGVQNRKNLSAKKNVRPDGRVGQEMIHKIESHLDKFFASNPQICPATLQIENSAMFPKFL